MTGGRTSDLRRRYLSLGVGELVAAGVFVVVMVSSVGPRLETRADRVACWAALVPLVVILLQAGVYWLMARRWIPGGRMPRSMAGTYRSFGIADAVLLSAGLVGVLAFAAGNVGVLALALGIWLFGVVEYVNYFVVRLAYPLHRWPTEVRRRRTPRLIRDLRSASG